MCLTFFLLNHQTYDSSVLLYERKYLNKMCVNNYKNTHKNTFIYLYVHNVNIQIFIHYQILYLKLKIINQKTLNKIINKVYLYNIIFLSQPSHRRCLVYFSIIECQNIFRKNNIIKLHLCISIPLCQGLIYVL